MARQHRHRTEFYVQRTGTRRSDGRYLFERNGLFGWGPKRIATRFRGAVDAERALCLVGQRHGQDVELVRA